jgi:hypothetical protein
VIRLGLLKDNSKKKPPNSRGVRLLRRCRRVVTPGYAKEVRLDEGEPLIIFCNACVLR